MGTVEVDVAEALRAGNVAYEEAFGQVFLIRASGRTAEEILGSLTERLTSSPEDEARVVAHELREIAVLRLRGLFS
ncbi:2-oxo-4-hydroxy-4-carboxy-5-ureidoimidazoline decarboxylase [Oerskovia sp. M15]